MSSIRDRINAMKKGESSAKKTESAALNNAPQTQSIQDRLAKARSDGLKQTGKPASTAPAKEYDLSGEAWTRATPSQTKIPSRDTDTQEKQGFLSRAADTVKSGFLNLASKSSNFWGTRSDVGGATAMGGVYKDQADMLQRQIESAQNLLKDSSISDQDRKELEQEISEWQRQLGIYGDAVRSNEETGKALYQVSDEAALAAQDSLNRAKDGLGTAGKTAVDVGSVLSELAMTTAAGTVLPSASRPFSVGGGTSAEYRRNADAQNATYDPKKASMLQTGAASGTAVGSALSHGVGQASLNLMRARGIQNYILPNIIKGGVESTGYMLGETGMAELSKALTYDDYEPDWNAIGTQALTSFAFGAIASTIRTVATTRQNKAYINSLNEAVKERYQTVQDIMQRGSPEQKATGAASVMDGVEELRNAINNLQVVGAQKEVDAINRFLNSIDAEMAQYLPNVTEAASKAAGTLAAPPSPLPPSGANTPVSPDVPAPVQPVSPASPPVMPTTPPAAPSQTPPASSPSSSVSEQLIAAGATAEEAEKLAPAIESVLNGEEISGNQAGAIARNDAAVSILETVTGEQIETDAPLGEVKESIKALASRQEVQEESPAPVDTPVETTPVDAPQIAPAAPADTNTQSTRNLSIIQDFAKDVDKAGSSALTSMYTEGQDPENYIAGMMKAYGAGKNGGDAIPTAILSDMYGITAPQAEAAYLAGQADAGVSTVAESGNTEYTGESKSGYSALAERLGGFNEAVQDGIRWTVEQRDGAYYVRVARAKGTEGYVEDARATAYKAGPFATREEAVADLLSVARNNFYPEKEDVRNGTESVAEVSDEGAVRQAGTGRQDAGGLLDAVPSENVQADARGGDPGADVAAERGGAGGLSRGTASERTSGVRSVGVHQGAGVQSADGGLTTSLDVKPEKEVNGYGGKEVSDTGNAESTGGAVQTSPGGKASKRERYESRVREILQKYATSSRRNREQSGRVEKKETRNDFEDRMRAGGYFYAETKNGGAAMGFKPAPEEKWSGEAKTANDALKKWGFEVIVFDGEMHTNRKGVSDISSAGQTLRDGMDITIFLSSNLDIDGLETAYHEALHAIRTGPNSLHRVKIENAILDNIDVDCDAFENFVTRIADLYSYSVREVSEERFAAEITEEAYAWFVGKLHASDPGVWGLDIDAFSDAKSAKAEIDAIFAKMEVATHGVETDHGDKRPAQGSAGNSREDRGGRPGPGGNGEQSGAVRRNARDNDGRDVVLPERRESDPALTTEEISEAATTEAQVEQKAELGNQEQPKGQNFIIPAKGGVKLPTTPKARFKANTDAIKTLRTIMADGRLATPQEQEALAKYTGWGGITDAFDEKKADWAKEFKQLKKLLDDGEYKSARASILDAYYTEPSVIQGMYNGLARIGFTGGRMLEPSAGVGRFIGAMPQEMAGGVQSWTAVELDKITGNIAKYLYPNADVRVQGYETAKIPDNYMDLVIGNVPFGNISIADKAYPASVTKSIHNYFIAKSLDKLRPGGIACLITSSGTMDAMGADARGYFMKKADLIGAIRLPNTAFEGTGTGVVSDILVFKKREPGTAYKGESFLEIARKPWEGPNMYGSYEINEYFVNHPEMVLGTASYGKGQYGRTVVTYNPMDSRLSLQKQIEKAFGNIKVKMEYPVQRTQEEIRAEIKADAGKAKQGAIVSKNGKLYKNDGGQLVEATEFKGADVQRVTDIVNIRDAARNLLDLQLDNGGEKAIADARKKLNSLYDAFVKKNGILNSPKNKKLLSGNVDAPFIRALENYDKDSGTATKAAIFTKNTVTAVTTATHADTVEEALTISMNETGGVDVKRIAQLTGRNADSVRSEILERGLAFKNRNGDLESAELYLSGNVRAKLRDAEALAEGDSEYERNVEALKKVIPADIPAEEIKVRLGATWVPDSIYSAFASEMLGGAGSTWKNGRRVPAIEVKYNRPVGKFFVEVNDSWLRNRPENTSTWGTEDYPFIGGRSSILESALNNKTVSVWRSVGDKRILDKQATAAAQEKMETVLTEFQRWMWSDETRRTELGGLYNDVFNNTVTPKYDGSHLTINGSNPEMEMRPHQKNAVQRIINSGGNTLLAHRVGAGKTYEMAAAAMKLRQLGIVKKPLIISPKNLVAQWGNEFLNYFPAAKILVLESDDFTPTNRKLFANRIATGDYDAVIMSYEQFGAVPMSTANQEAFYQSQIDALEMAILESKRASGKDPSIRDMERSKKSFEAKLKKLGDSKKDVDNIDFEQLGVDALFVDEAHNFKNLFYTTKMQGIADLGNKEGSQRAFDLYMKVRYLQQLNGGRGIVFATATPVMNSVVELYTMQRYLQGDLLDAKGLTNFDAWANQFGDVVTIRKMKTGGNGYEIKQSLSKYKNLGEMQQMFRGFADVIVDAADLPYLKIPKMKTGKRIVVECEPSPFQEQFMEDLGKRADALRGAGKGGSEDHIFKVFNDGKKISYTQRMIDSSLPYEDGGKIMKCVENVSRIWKESEGIKGTQLIFCDQGTPGGAEASRGAALYEDIKNLLVGSGIPANEIAFIHDATNGEAKTKLFKDVNDGKVRVLLGSTSTMGVGMNAQKRIVAMHELNAPDRPGDLEQNEGRGLRQGNINDEVAVYAYVTKKTFDSRQWDNLKRKATFIHQVMSGEYNGREAAGDGDLALSAAEISAIASDNPLIMEQFELSEKINNLEMLERAHTKEVLDAKERIKKAERQIATDEITLEHLKKDLASRKDTAGDKFVLVVGGNTYTERKAAGAAIIAAAKKHLDLKADTESSTEIGTFAGFKLLVTSKGDMLLRGVGQYRGTVNMDDASGTISRLQNVADRIETMMKATETRIAENKSAIKKLEKTAASSFTKADELIAARVRESEIMAELNPPSEQAVSSAEAEGDVENMVDHDVSTDAAPHPERWQAARVGDPGKAPKPISEIVEQIRHDFGLNITQGHIRGAGVRGQYNRRDNGIRTRIANDLPTISHELGHALDVRWGVLGNGLTDTMRKELVDGLSDEMKAAYQPRQYLSEGYAEYIRKFLQNRETAAIDYPEFTKHFLNSLSPKDAALLEQLADDINAYYSLDADTATSSIRLREERSPDARTWGEKIKAKANVLYQAWVDSNHGIREFDKATGANTYKLATNSAYSDAIAGQIITGDLTDANGQYVGPGLKAALHGLDLNDKQQYKLFGEYLAVKHGPERLAEGMRIFADDRKNSTAWMQNRQAQLEQQYPEFKEISERLYQFQADFLKTWGVDTGLVSQQSADEWAKRWKFYVPFNRAVSQEKRGIGAKRGFANQNSTIKQARGSGLDIVHPVDNIINNLVKMVNAGVRNNVMRRITDEAERLGADASFLEKVPTPMVRREFDMTGVKEQLTDWIEGSTMRQVDKDQATGIIGNLDDVLAQYGRGKAHGDVITVLKGGQQEFWKINDPLMLQSITNMSPKKMDGILDAYAVVSRFMTGNITGNNIIWSLFSNFPRDLGTFFTYSKTRNPAKVFAAMGSAYVNKIKGDSADLLFKEYLAMGGGKTSAYTADRDLAKKARKALAEKKFDVNPLDWITFVSDTVELGPRFATYKLMRQAGMNPQEAFYEACDITVNFRRGGDISRQINKVVPFFNASVQGLDKFRRWITAADAPQADRAKVVRSRTIAYIAVSAALAAMFYALNNGDDDKEKDYQQLSNYTKNSYWNIPIGDGKYFAIPKPRELAVLSSFFETCMEYGIGGNEHAFDEFYEYATDNFLPSVLSDLAQAPVKGLMESASGAAGSLGIIGVVGYMSANRDFLGRPIVSTGLQNLEPKDQYTERTSKIAYWVGQAFNVSPQMVDYFFSSTLGGWWKAQKALFPVGKENVDLTLGVQNTYVKDNQYSTDLVNWLYDKADASKRAKNSDQKDMEKAITYKMDSNMTTFYSRYYKLAKNQPETTATRATRQIVLDMILEYRKSADAGTSTRAQDAVNAVCDREGSTEFLPSVMQSTIKDGGGNPHTLSDVQYVEYQTDYLRIYWENVEQNLTGAQTESEKVAILKSAKELAKEQATNRTLKRIGADATSYFDKYGNVGTNDVIQFQAQVDLANQADKAAGEGSADQDDIIGILEIMIEDGLSYEDAYMLFHSKYDSDKNNPWRRYKP